jgi:biopolymer transport protein ExbD
MRRFSQRNSLVTLNDINITPLLDLAFVLLIIFVITTPLLEKGLDLHLPSGVGHPDQPLNRNDIKMVEIGSTGYLVLDHKQMSLEQMSRTLEEQHRSNPRMLVFIRADENGKYKLVADVLDACERIGITNISLRADAKK